MHPVARRVAPGRRASSGLVGGCGMARVGLTPVATANEDGRRLLTPGGKSGANGPAGFGRPVLGASSSPVAAEPQTSQIKAAVREGSTIICSPACVGETRPVGHMPKFRLYPL